jgi:hypothetical protein
MPGGFTSTALSSAYSTSKPSLWFPLRTPLLAIHLSPSARERLPPRWGVCMDAGEQWCGTPGRRVFSHVPCGWLRPHCCLAWWCVQRRGSLFAPAANCTPATFLSHGRNMPYLRCAKMCVVGGPRRKADSFATLAVWRLGSRTTWPQPSHPFDASLLCLGKRRGGGNSDRHPLPRPLARDLQATTVHRVAGHIDSRGVTAVLPSRRRHVPFDERTYGDAE